MTKRKAAAQKAHSTYRKSAPKAAAKKARGTYRKTSAQFEEFVHDAQMPEAMRTLAEKSVAQTRELCEHSLEAVLESWERFVDAGQGAVALNRQAIDIARAQYQFRFRFCGELNQGEEPCRDYGI